MEMDTGARAWLIKKCRAEHWRVHQDLEFLDLYQEGCLCWVIVAAKYEHIKERKHIMALFKTTVSNRIHDLAKAHSRLVSLIDYNTPLDTLELYSDPREAEQGDNYFIPSAAPWFVRAFLRIFCDPEMLRRYQAPYRVRLSGVREMTHDRLCRLIGADPSSTPHLPGAIEDYLRTI